MAERAVLVDGVGGTREMAIGSVVENIRVPMTRRMTVIDPQKGPPQRLELRVADFRLVGQLPDGRYVYGFEFDRAKYALWRVTSEWIDGIPQLRDLAAQEAQHNIDAIGSSPSVILYDVTTPQVEPQVLRREVWGVARRGDHG